MGRGLKIALGLLAGLIVLLVVNALVTDADTAPAEATVPGARLVAVQGGELQILERGPRDGRPVVLIHCYTCALGWWDEMAADLAAAGRRVIALDLLGHGGSEKPASGYSIESQADLVAGLLGGLGVRQATVVGHSLGGSVTVALAERSPAVVGRLVIVDEPSGHDEGDLGTLARLTYLPVLGQGLWRAKTDLTVRDGLEVAFAPGYEVPDEFVEELRRMTYTAYRETVFELDDFLAEETLAERLRRIGKPTLVTMGAEEQIVDDPEAALRAYTEVVPAIRTELIDGAGHSPNVERPALTAALVLAFEGE